jgi:carbonic anhydrase
MMTSDEAIKRLIDGNARYAAGTPSQLGVSAELRTSLCAGQSPYAAVVGCSDSRVPVELIFDAGPGELFVVRTAGNVVGAFEMGSLEFAVEGLKTPVVVILGHQQCGAVKAAINGGEFSPNLQAIVNEICECTPDISGGDLERIEDKNILYTLSKIAANPCIEKAVSQGSVRLMAAKYSLETGIVSFLN